MDRNEKILAEFKRRMFDMKQFESYYKTLEQILTAEDEPSMPNWKEFRTDKEVAKRVILKVAEDMGWEVGSDLTTIGDIICQLDKEDK